MLVYGSGVLAGTINSLVKIKLILFFLDVAICYCEGDEICDIDLMK